MRAIATSIVGSACAAGCVECFPAHSAAANLVLMAAGPSNSRPRRVYGACTACGITRAEAGGLSHRGLCSSCAERNVTENVMQLVEKRGPSYDRWAAGLLAAAQRCAS